MAQEAPAQATTTQALRIKKLVQTVEVAPDGKAVTTTHSEVQVMTPSAATAAQLPVTYNAMLADAEVSDAYTQKVDGRKIAVDPSNIVAQKPASAPLAPIYTDREQKLVLFPNVEAGDSVVFTSRISDKTALTAGQFTTSHYFSTGIEADETSYSITVPKTMPLFVDANGVEQTISSSGDLKTYRWTFSNLSAKAMPKTMVMDPDRQIHFAASTFASYDDFGHYFARQIMPVVVVTPEVQKQADAITAGVTDKHEQARLIYEWVSQHIRYVAIEIGTSSLIPHGPDWTLTNAFGDCKDHAVLFASLLKAKNIPAQLVLINAANTYSLGKVPTVIGFNHVIAWLPDLRIYADTTAPGTKFGELPIADYAKPVVHLVESGPAVHATPAIAAGLLSSNYKVHAVMTPEGRFDVDMTISATGPWAGALRQLGASIQKLDPAAAAQALLKLHKFPNATGTVTVAPINLNSSTYSLSGTFHAGRPTAQANMLALANGLRMLPMSGDGPMGPSANTSLTVSDETPCYSARQVEDVEIDFVNGQHLASPPADVQIKTAHILYQTHWTIGASSATLHREFVATMDKPVCSDEIRVEAADALAKIRADHDAPTRLAVVAATASSTGQGAQ
jgi:transglutaminase-like putative cysteine protease